MKRAHHIAFGICACVVAVCALVKFNNVGWAAMSMAAAAAHFELSGLK